jgi:hypothetical protein
MGSSCLQMLEKGIWLQEKFYEKLTKCLLKKERCMYGVSAFQISNMISSKISEPWVVNFSEPTLS